jgi:hypothetical protein
MPGELSSSFCQHWLDRNVERELLYRRERLPGDDDRPVSFLPQRQGRRNA